MRTSLGRCGGIAAIVLPVAGFLGGCAAQLSDAEISKLKGGTTTVVVYGFCVPMDQIIKSTLYRYTFDISVDGKIVGSMQNCGHSRFTTKSGYWDTTFTPRSGLSFGHSLAKQAYRPGATQYLYMYPAGHGTFDVKWVSKAEADAGIAEIKQIGQMF